MVMPAGGVCVPNDLADINAQNLRMSKGAGTPRGIERQLGRKLRHSSPQAQPRADALIAAAPRR